MITARKRTKVDQLQRAVEEYRAAGMPWPPTTRMLAEWAIETDRYRAPPEDLLERLAKDFARAMREEHIVDPQNRRVRRKHALRDEQGTFWVDIEDATPEQMEIAFSQRRGQVLGDCRQLKTDVDSYNENNSDGAHIQMVFDFTDDLIEMEQPSDYPGL